MDVTIAWENDVTHIQMDDNTTEYAFYKAVSDVMTNDINPPAWVNVTCPYGTARYQIIARSGTAFIREDDNQIVFSKTGRDYKEVYLTKIDPEYNNYKYYRLTPQGDKVVATYGRIGLGKDERFGERSYEYPLRMYWTKYREKIAKGYVDQSKVYLSPDKERYNTGNELTQPIAEQQTANTPGSVLYAMLKRFARHHVEENCVSTVVSYGMIEEAGRLLNILYKRKTVDPFNRVLLKLMAVCPRRVSNVADLLAKGKSDFARIIAREEDLLAAMEAIADGNPKKTVQTGSFGNIEVFVATDKQKSQVMDRLSSDLRGKVKQVYRVIPQEQQERFNAYLKQHGIKQVKQLWHGSRNENWLSIIQNSLKLRPDAVITGKMFGDGIYFAPSSMKSWNYTSFRGSKWANGQSDIGFMGLYATAYGTPFDVDSSGRYTQQSLTAIGKNCVHAHAGKQLLNDEIIFYDEDAVVLNYIVEFAA